MMGLPPLSFQDAARARRSGSQAVFVAWSWFGQNGVGSARESAGMVPNPTHQYPQKHAGRNGTGSGMNSLLLYEPQSPIMIASLQSLQA